VHRLAIQRPGGKPASQRLPSAGSHTRRREVGALKLSDRCLAPRPADVAAVEAKEGVGVIHRDRGGLETLWASIELTRGKPGLKLTEFHVISTVRLAQRRVY